MTERRERASPVLAEEATKKARLDGRREMLRERHAAYVGHVFRPFANAVAYLAVSPACLSPSKLGAWIPLRPSASSPSQQCLCATRWKGVAIGSCCYSRFRALSGLSTASFRGLGRLAWLREFGQRSPCGAGSRRHISDFCVDQ